MNTEIKQEQSFIFLIIVVLLFGWCNMQSVLAMTSSVALARAQKKLASSAQAEMPKAAQSPMVDISPSFSDEQKKEFLRKILQTIPEGQRRVLTGDKVIGIIRPSEQTEQVSEQPMMNERIDRLEKQLTDFERQLNSPSVNVGAIQHIGYVLYNSINQELMQLPVPEDRLQPLRDRANALGEQLTLFDALFRLANDFTLHVDDRTVTNEIIDIVEQKLNELRKDTERLKVQASSSLYQKIDELTKQVEQQKHVQRSEIERYLTRLENALKTDSVDAEMIKNIRISIDEVIGDKKPRLPVNQREMIEKRISNLKALVSLFESVIPIEDAVAQGDIILATLGYAAKRLNDLSKTFKSLKLPEEQSAPVDKRITYLKTQLTSKLLEFIEQLEHDVEVMSARSDVTLAEIEKMLALLDQIKAVRSNLTLPEDQARNTDERIADIADLLTDERSFLHRKELSEKRHAALQVIREQEELQRKKDQERMQEFRAQEERRMAQLSTVSTEPQETVETVQTIQTINPALPIQPVQKPEAKVDEKLEEKRIVSLLRWKMKGLLEAFTLAYQIWFDRQLEEDALCTSCMRLSRRTTDKEKLVLQSLAAHLENSKSNINLLVARVGTIDQAVDQLFKQSEHKQSDLVELMHYWQTMLASIEELSEKTHRALFEQNQQKKREGKATSLAFIKRNDDVMRVIAKLLGRISIIKIANRNKIEQLSKPLPVPQKEQCISKRLRR